MLPSPDGLAQAFILDEEFIGSDPCVLVLGDNIFYGYDLQKQLEVAVAKESCATVFAYHVHDPERYDVVECDKQGQLLHWTRSHWSLRATMRLLASISTTTEWWRFPMV